MKIIAFIFALVLLCPIYSTAITLSDSDMHWLTQNIYWEARNQSKKGQALVGIVTINRMMDGRWPRSIKGVVTQPGQFEWYSDGKPDIPTNKRAYNKAKKIAVIVCNLYDYLDPKYKKIFWFHAKGKSPKWRHDYNLLSKSQNHLFYMD